MVKFVLTLLMRFQRWALENALDHAVLFRAGSEYVPDIYVEFLARL